MVDLDENVALQRAILQEIAETLNRHDVQNWRIVAGDGVGFYLSACDKHGCVDFYDLYLGLFLETGSYQVSSPWYNGKVVCSLSDPESLSRQGLLRAVNSVKESGPTYL